ncbi:MAG: PAS domain-containing protein [Synergistaceae bacterium]|jgi:predicted transcriptional regulator YheO|nr:PAS domain-containing protein [Synergistaceae bacterium]
MALNGKLRRLIPFIDFIAEVVGPNSEVVLHDTGDLEKSLVAIRNGSLSGRETGSQMSEFARKILDEGKRTGKPFISNYLGKSYGGGKFLKSSTFFIRDDNDEIIGMIGINTDLSALSEVHRILGQMLEVGGIEENSESDGERASIRETVLSVIDEVIGRGDADPVRMTLEEKKNIVCELNERGVFLLKGTVAEVASRLDVSEQTIYRYLK